MQSDKATVEITSKFDGLVKKLYYSEKELAKVGKPLMDIEIEKVEEETRNVSSEKALAQDRNSEKTQKQQIKATPAIRRLAKELSVDLEGIVPAGNGVITEADIRKNTQSGIGSNLNIFQKAMLKQMSAALKIPHFGLCDEAEIDELYNYAKKSQEKLFPHLVKALSDTLKKWPILNSTFDNQKERLDTHTHHNIGIAVDTNNGLIVPVVKNVEKQGVKELSGQLKELVEKGRDNVLSKDDLQDGTITISNIGSISGTFARPVIVAPQVCILVIGRVQMIPRFDKHGKLVQRIILPISWAADHRVIDGATIAKASSTFIELLSHKKWET